MHAHNGSLLDLLQLWRELLLLGVLQLCAPTQLGKSGYDEVADLVELLVARNEEHIPCNAIFNHSLSSNTVVTEGQEDPRNVSLYNAVVYGAEGVKKVHHTFLDQYVDGLFVQRKVYKCQCRELLNLNISPIILT